MTDHTKELTPDRLYYFKRQVFQVEDFEAPGLILDIGGGGEGIIGRMKGAQVIAIDNRREELEHAPEGPLKLVMDACEMMFLDCSFNTATSFLTLMYFPDSEHAKLFGEIFRVLAPGGRLLVWDVSIPRQLSPDKEIAAYPVTIYLPDSEEINAGYGALWPDEDHDLQYYAKLAGNAGFQVVSQREKGETIYMELQKPILPHSEN